MRIDVTMQRFGPQSDEAAVVAWLKFVGDTVEIGDDLAEVETDKATVVLCAMDAGVLIEHRVALGEAVQVGNVIAVLDDAATAGGQPASDTSV